MYSLKSEDYFTSNLVKNARTLLEPITELEARKI